MKATFYRFYSNQHGYYVQREKPEKKIDVTKSDLLKFADLRHPVCTENEFYHTLSTDINGMPKKTFELLGHNHLIIVER